MSESERHEAQGRAYAELKQARSNAATLSASLAKYAEDLLQTSTLTTQFTKEPHFKTSSFIKLSEHLKATVLQLHDPNKIVRWIDELVVETERVKVLQEQVEKF